MSTLSWDERQHQEEQKARKVSALASCRTHRRERLMYAHHTSTSAKQYGDVNVCCMPMLLVRKRKKELRALLFYEGY